jgi:hypothetical protein
MKKHGHELAKNQAVAPPSGPRWRRRSKAAEMALSTTEGDHDGSEE